MHCLGSYLRHWRGANNFLLNSLGVEVSECPDMHARCVGQKDVVRSQCLILDDLKQVRVDVFIATTVEQDSDLTNS